MFVFFTFLKKDPELSKKDYNDYRKKDIAINSKKEFFLKKLS